MFRKAALKLINQLADVFIFHAFTCAQPRFSMPYFTSRISTSLTFVMEVELGIPYVLVLQSLHDVSVPQCDDTLFPGDFREVDDSLRQTLELS